MNTRARLRPFALAAALYVGALFASAAQAQDVNVELRVVTPHLRLPGHVVLPLPPLLLPRVVVSQPAPRWQAPPPPRQDSGYREPTRWDVDGDGVPNRYDRVYNPRWDRDGDGVPNRYDPTPQGGHWQQAPRDWRQATPAQHRGGVREDWRGEWRGDWREARQDVRRDDRRDDRQYERRSDRQEVRRDDRRDDYRRGNPD